MTLSSYSWIAQFLPDPDTQGCAVHGTLTPDPTGGHFYRITGQMDATDCGTSNIRMRGYVTVSGAVMTGGVLWESGGMPLVLTRI